MQYRNYLAFCCRAPWEIYLFEFSFTKLLRDHKGHVVQSWKSEKKKQSLRVTFTQQQRQIKEILLPILDPGYIHKNKRGFIIQQSYQHPQPPWHLPSLRLRGEDERLFYSPLYLSTSTLSSSPALSQPSLQFNYSWLFPIPSCLRDVHLWNKDTLTLGTEKRKEERQNIHQISNLHENKPHCSAGKKWIEMRTCQERGGIISIWPNKRASTEL